jgi:hypothetical protein
MNSKFLPFAIVGSLVVMFFAAGSVWYFVAHKNPQQNPPAPGGVACTQEAMECPDGSYVGRTGPNCEFAACPNAETSTPATGEGLIKGIVLLGPTCPVERIPPDPACAPKPYQTSIGISKNIENPESFLTIQSTASGTFSVSLPAGEYVFHPKGGSPFPRCDEQLVEVSAGNVTTTAINCDTGIR